MNVSDFQDNMVSLENYCRDAQIPVRLHTNVFTAGKKAALVGIAVLGLTAIVLGILGNLPPAAKWGCIGGGGGLLAIDGIAGVRMGIKHKGVKEELNKFINNIDKSKFETIYQFFAENGKNDKPKFISEAYDPFYSASTLLKFEEGSSSLDVFSDKEQFKKVWNNHPDKKNFTCVQKKENEDPKIVDYYIKT